VTNTTVYKKSTTNVHLQLTVSVYSILTLSVEKKSQHLMFICGKHQCLGATSQQWLLTSCQRTVDVYSTLVSSVCGLQNMPKSVSVAPNPAGELMMLLQAA